MIRKFISHGGTELNSREHTYKYRRGNFSNNLMTLYRTRYIKLVKCWGWFAAEGFEGDAKYGGILNLFHIIE